MRQEKLYIAGEWRDSCSGGTFEVINPATGEKLGRCARADRSDTVDAVDSAFAARSEWAKIPVKIRGEILRKVHDLMRERQNHMAEILTLESGKPLGQSHGELNMAADTVLWFAEEARRAYGSTIPQGVTGKRWFTFKHPVGVVATIGPWNFPVVLQSRKMAGALAAGCPVVMKPASLTPFSSIEFLKCFIDAGVPDGVVNMVTGSGAELGYEFATNPKVAKITFTGSTESGQKLMEWAAPGIKRLSLELGGHAPVIVFDDADIEQAAIKSAGAKFRNAGQVCIAPNRFFIHNDIYDEFVEHFLDTVKNMKVGNGMDEGVDIGPMVTEDGLKKAIRHVEDAKAKGAKVLIGGYQLTGGEYDRGFFMAPAVLADVPPSAMCSCEETFGPVAPLYRFDDEDDVYERANSTEFGLAGYVFTENYARVFRAAERLEAGIIGINDSVPATVECPFGGMKKSGLGRECGREGLEAFLETKFVSIGMPE